MEKLIYVCTPYSASTVNELFENLELAKRVCQRVLTENDVPVAPHLYFPRLTRSKEAGINCSVKLLEKCDAVYVSGGRITQGMAKEIEIAASLGIPIKCVADPKYAEQRKLKENMEGENEHE